MRQPLKLLMVLFALGLVTQRSPGEELRLYNPYERPKNGPPLTKIFHKVEPAWLLAKLRNPKHHPSARMPDFKFTDDEALDVMAYLKSIAGEPLPKIQWPAWAAKGIDEMNDGEKAAMFRLAERGKAVWGRARCTICHSVIAPGDRIVGGFVDLRVGGIDLQIARTKLNKRDWLYQWLKEPKNYFPGTLMPRYRFSDDEIKSLIEFILRDDSFVTSSDEPAQVDPERWKSLDKPEGISRGKRLIEVSRCVLCHDIENIPEVLRGFDRKLPPSPGSFEFLAYDLRCLSCHSIEGRGGTYAPDLTGEGSRVHEAWIAQFVQSPDMIRPLSQQMPKFNLTAEEARLIASYLSKIRRDTRIPNELPGGRVTTQQVQRGRESFRIRGCFSCHSVGEGSGGSVGPALETVADRLRPGYIGFHLKSPHGFSPYTAEPDYGLSDEEAAGLATYLLGKKK